MNIKFTRQHLLARRPICTMRAPRFRYKTDRRRHSKILQRTSDSYKHDVQHGRQK